MIAILTESFGGIWPFWLSPFQVKIVPVSSHYDDYAKRIQQELREAGFECDTDLDAGNTLNKKVRNAQIEHYNFILVVGEREEKHNTVNIRTRDNKIHGEVSISEMLRRFKALIKSKTNKAEDEFGLIVPEEGVSKQIEIVNSTDNQSDSLNQENPAEGEKNESSSSLNQKNSVEVNNDDVSSNQPNSVVQESNDSKQ